MYLTFRPLAGVNTVRDLERFPWPDVWDSKCHEHLAGETRKAKAEGYTVVGQMSQTILETAYEMRGIEAGRRVNPDFHVLYHSDGALTPLLPELIDVGVTCINPCQPEVMGLEDVKQRFGGHLTLWGCCPSQSIYATGTRAQARRSLEAMIRELAPGGGLVVQFYNVLLTPRLLDNLVAFVGSFYDLAARG
jgi:hypothetical protein